MYIDIETSSGVKCGDGPIITADDFNATKRLDRAGMIRFPLRAADERAALVLPKRVARARKLIYGVMTEIGAGIIDNISVKTDNKGAASLDVSGDDRLRELTYGHVGKLEIGTEPVPATTGPADIAAMFPAGWSLDTVTGHSATLKAIHHKFEGESCLAALIKLVDLTGEHFRLGVGRQVIWMQDDRPSSGVRAIQGGEPVGLESNLDVCLITDLEETQDTYDCYIGRVYGYGIGDGDSRVHFHDAVNNHVPEGYLISSDAKGWFLQHTATWNAYGIQRYMSFKDVNDATTLAEQAYEYMSRRLAAQKSYRLSVTKLDREIVVGSTIRVTYKRVVDTYVAVNIDTDLVVLEATTKVDKSGMRTVDLQVATTDAWPESDTSATVDGLGQSQNFYTHSQGFTTSVDTWATIAEALGMIILTPANGDPCVFYDPNEAGVDDALGDAVAGDGIYGPYPIEIAMTHGITVPASVRVRDLNLAFTCGGSAVTLDDYDEIQHCRFSQDGTGEATTLALDARSIRDVKITNSYILAMNATTNIGAWLSGVAEDHGPEAKGSWIQAFNGTNAVSLYLQDDAFVESSYVGGTDASYSNIGVAFDSVQSGKRAGQFINSWSVVLGAGGWGATVSNNHYGRAIGSYFVGPVVGVYIQTGCTLDVGNCTWSTITNSGTINYLTGDRSPVDHVHPGFLPWFNVKTYGAIGDGSTDDTAAIEATFVQLEAAGGGVLYFPYGNYVTSGGHALDAPITVRGDGASAYLTEADESGGDVAVTRIECTSATNSLFIVNAPGCNFKDFSAQCTNANPTAGAGITVVYYGDLIHYENLFIKSFYNCIDIQDGAEWFMDGCSFYEPVVYGLKAAHTLGGGDWGDTHISNCSFFSGHRNSAAAIYITSGGGWKLTNIKINGWEVGPPTGEAFNVGIYVYSDAGVNTILFQISNSSIENCITHGFYMATNPDNSHWNQIFISNVEFGMFGATGHCIYLNPYTSGDIDYVHISNCSMAHSGSSANAAIKLSKVNHARLSTITNIGFASILEQISCTDIIFLDEMKLDDWQTPDDNTDLDATDGHHGLLPKLSGDSGDVLLGDGTWGAGTPTALTVEEQDGTPSVANVNKIKVTNGSLTDDGGGVVSLVTGAGSGGGAVPDHVFEFIGPFSVAAGAGIMYTQYATGRWFGISWYQHPAANGDSVQLNIILDAGTYNFTVWGATQNNLGKLDWSMDSTNFITGQDWYSSSLVEGVAKTGSVTISAAGIHTLKLTVNGKNGSSSDYYWILTAIMLSK